MDIKTVISSIKAAGCNGKYDPSCNWHHVKDIPSWDTYKLVRQWRGELCAIALTKHLFQKPAAIQPDKDNSKCPYCTHFNMSGCPYKAAHKIPAGTFHKGCEHHQPNNSVYF